MSWSRPRWRTGSRGWSQSEPTSRARRRRWPRPSAYPNNATGVADSDYTALEQMAQHPRCVAIGETGLDYYRDHASPADQAVAFRAQLEIARMFGKPVVIHTRDADDDTIRLLEQHAGGMKVIIHCFSMASRIDECLAHEHWWISFAGNVTYPKNQDLRDAALRVPADRMLVETDAPYLSPQAQRGKPNSPALVAQTAQALALERRVSYHDFNVEVESAAQAVFGW